MWVPVLSSVSHHEMGNLNILTTTRDGNPNFSIAPTKLSNTVDARLFVAADR